MSYVELSEHEINEIVEFINEQREILEEVDGKLGNLTKGFRVFTTEEFEKQPRDIQADIMDARATLLSSITTVLSSVSGLTQKLKSVPSKILSALSAFLKSFWKTISKYISIFKIESITVTISITPSVVVVLKP